MDFHTFCEQHMEVLEELSVEELRQQALMTEWERRQNEAKVKELQKTAMTSVSRLNKKIKEMRIKIKELEEKVAAEHECEDDLMDVCAKSGAC
jgi:uncharacterized protein YigA (DUF484 family)